MHMPTLNRRSFLQSAAAGAAALGFSPRSHASTSACSPDAPQAKNLIFMVADGMSFGTLTLADLMSRQRDGRPGTWVSLWNQPGVRRASAMTYSADSWVTDSAAGGSAWGCGVHINNGAVNVTPTGNQRIPLLVQARQNGKATGLVTTTRVTHATPASFIANVTSREMEREIARQTLARSVDVVLGGGAHYFSDELIGGYKSLQVVRDRAALLEAATSPPSGAGGSLLGLFHKEHVPFTLDRDETIPSLADMTRAALAKLSTNPNGFVVQIEGGRVDHAAHSNDAGAIITEQLDFDAAIAQVLAFVKGRNDTLVILTTDHGNANPGLTLYTSAGKKAFDRLAHVKHSNEWIETQFAGAAKAGSLAGKLAEIVEAATGVGLDQKEREILAPMLTAHPPREMPFARANKWTSVLGALLADHFGVAFTSPNHTSDMVEVTALGPGSERLQPMIENTDLHGLVCGALALAEPAPLPGMDQVLAPAKAGDD